MTVIEKDEILKATAHGIVLGCTIPVLAYNVAAGRRHNYLNVAIYALFIGFELWQITQHVQEAKKSSEV